MATRPSIFTLAFSRHMQVVERSLQQIMPDVESAARTLLAALQKGRKVLACGNGGSAADSQHFIAELTGRYKKERGALPGIALSTDTSALTAIGNDYGYERVFARQVEALGKPGDVLVAFSTSGSSPNVLAAIASARAKKMKVIFMTSERGARARRHADVAITVPSDETARIQEIHELVYHAWCEYIDSKFEEV